MSRTTQSGVKGVDFYPHYFHGGSILTTLLYFSHVSYKRATDHTVFLSRCQSVTPVIIAIVKRF